MTTDQQLRGDGTATKNEEERELQKVISLAMVERPHVQYSTDFPLQLCQGDCDVDSDCANGLVCFQRDSFESVPGCEGGEIWANRADFCIVPRRVGLTKQPLTAPPTMAALTNNPTSPPTTLLPTSTPPATQSPTSNPTTSAPTKAPTSNPTTSAPTKAPTSNPTTSAPTKAVPTTVPPSTAPSDTPTDSPSPMPTPLYANPANIMLTYIGNDEDLSLGLCQGDCDTDDDCSGNLICYQRDEDEAIVPGCLGSPLTNLDYCIPPPKYIQFLDGEQTTAYQLCQGPCQTDDDCIGALVCFERSGSRMPVPGCLGGKQDVTDDNVCTLSGYTSVAAAAAAATPAPTTLAPTTLAPSPSVSTVLIEPSSILRVHLKLYWEEGYDWQEVYYDLNYCMNHDYYVGWMDCWYGWEHGECREDQMYVSKCKDYERQLFDILILDATTQEAWITPADENRCFTRVKREVYLTPCDPADEMQRWIPLNGPWDNYRFEIVPITKPDICMTQMHHPKAAEVIELMNCDNARSDFHLTSFWNTY